MNENREGLLLRIGMVAALALLVAAAAIVGITSRHKLFERKIEYYSLFPDAAGLKDGSGVWFQGMEVGYVSSLGFSSDPDSPKVMVRYKISASLAPRIRSTTRASIKSLGLLGDKFLSLATPQKESLTAPNILPGNEIPIDPAINLEALGRGAQDVIQGIQDLSDNLNKLLTNINEGNGVVARLLRDPKLGQETVDHIGSIAKSLDTVSSAIADGHSFAGKMLSDRAYGEQTAQDLSESLHRLNELLGDVQEGRGGAGALISKKGQGEAIVANLARASEGLAKVADSLQKPGTLGNRLFMDEQYGEHVAQNLLSMSDSMASILRKVDQGQGTLGALVNDRSVYDTLSAVADGIRKSTLVQWYLRKKAEDAAKGAKTMEKAKP